VPEKKQAIFTRMRLSLFSAIELLLLFILFPVALFLWGDRMAIFLSLWGFALYALLRMHFMPGFSWRNLWQGQGWSSDAKRAALIRFAIAALLLFLLVLVLPLAHLFQFPRERPVMWLIVMLVYPFLSALPQEIIYRSFFFRAYGGKGPDHSNYSYYSGGFLALNAVLFGFSHLPFNPVAMGLSAVGGFLFAYSYRLHRSLKWALIEHAAYGCLVFTLGLGVYFYLGAWR
jgi:membrane protease YdiL (CAAX protease family)